MTYHSLPIPKVFQYLAGTEPPFIVLETSRFDAENHVSYIFTEPDSVLQAFRPADFPSFFTHLESLLSRGYYLSGFFAYEAGTGLDPVLQTRKIFPFPLARFYAFRNPLIFDHRAGTFNREFISGKGRGPARPGYRLRKMSLNVGSEEYCRNIVRIKDLIAAGDTYQVNYTLKVKFGFDGSLPAFYRDLRKRQPVSYAALLQDADFGLLSFSPELFFRKAGDTVTVRPMKGTISRGRDRRADLHNQRQLKASFKDRSENVMIVDLLRNDLGRISRIGAVNTRSLFDLERYPTLYQMTSTISAETRPDLSFAELYKALFPSGSVTGAPKISTMKIIRKLEREPRLVYTGAIGLFLPNRDAVFNVAIRTIMAGDGRGEMGIGSGIVSDSEAEAEYAECRLKALFLSGERSGLEKMPVL